MDRDIQGFVMYRDYMEYCGFLSNEEKGLLLDALFGYAFEGEKPEGLSPVCALAFSVMKNQMDRDFEKYERKCEKNRKNGALGGRPKKEEATKAEDSKEEAMAEAAHEAAEAIEKKEAEAEAESAKRAEGKKGEKRQRSEGEGRKCAPAKGKAAPVRDDDYYDDFFSAAIECALEGASP